MQEVQEVQYFVRYLSPSSAGTNSG